MASKTAKMLMFDLLRSQTPKDVTNGLHQIYNSSLYESSWPKGNKTKQIEIFFVISDRYYAIRKNKLGIFEGTKLVAVCGVDDTHAIVLSGREGEFGFFKLKLVDKLPDCSYFPGVYRMMKVCFFFRELFLFLFSFVHLYIYIYIFFIFYLFIVYSFHFFFSPLFLFFFFSFSKRKNRTWTSKRFQFFEFSFANLSLGF